jgi:hypothetical protein
MFGVPGHLIPTQRAQRCNYMKGTILVHENYIYTNMHSGGRKKLCYQFIRSSVIRFSTRCLVTWIRCWWHRQRWRTGVIKLCPLSYVNSVRTVHTGDCSYSGNACWEKREFFLWVAFPCSGKRMIVRRTFCTYEHTSCFRTTNHLLP